MPETQQAPATNGTAPSGTSQPQAAPSSTPSFQLPPDIAKQYPSLAKFKDVSGLAKSYGELEKSYGGAIRIPGPDATEEQRAEYYTKLGRPETPDKYEIQFAENTPVDEKLLSTYRSEAYKLGLTQEQAKGLAEWWAGQAQGMGEAGSEDIKADLAKWDQELDQTWGWQKDRNIELASRALKTAIGNDAELGAKVVELLDSTGIGNHPEMLKLFHKIAMMQGEDKFIEGPSAPTQDDRTTAQEQINEMRGNPEHPYNNKKHPGHRDAVARMEQLYKVLYAPAE